MTEILVHEYDEYATYAEDWQTNDSEDRMQSRWQLLGLLDADEFLVLLPEWLAEEKVGYIDGATPTEFVGRIERETEKAILLGESTGARPLMRLAHRITNLAGGSETTDPASRDFLERRLRELRRDFADRDQYPGLQDGWLPKSQLLKVVRRS